MRSSLKIILASELSIVQVATATPLAAASFGLWGDVYQRSASRYDGPPNAQDFFDYSLQLSDARHPQVDPPLDHSVQLTTRSKGWEDPAERGGSMLDLVGNGLREPINAIISGHSDPEILTEAGLRDYVRSIGFSFECLDLHRGGAQHANLGDGAGWRPQLFEYRSTQSFGAPGRWVGACWESWNGGDHFRVWKQNGSEAKTGAWFLAVSREKSLRHRHTIAPNGYNEGRDLLVFNAVAGGEFGQKRWKADVKWVEGLMPSGSEGINHGIAIDGMTAVLTVQRYWSLSWTKFYPPVSIFTAAAEWTASGVASVTSQAMLGVLRFLGRS